MANIILKLFRTINILPIFAIKTNNLLFKIKTYLSFLINATNEHGVHSPFVFDFITKCIYKKNDIPPEKNNKINAFRDALLKNNQSINVTDFGAGSKVFKGNTRVVSAIAKNAGITKKRSLLLYKIAQYFKSDHILEIGTSLGIATNSLALANKNKFTTTLEGCPETAKVAQNEFDKFKLKNITLHIGDFKNTLSLAIADKKYDLIYFDGNHQKQSTIDYFEQCLSAIHNETVFIFDDIHWSKGMEQAWEYIKNHKRVTVTIDSYQWGIVFFRKEQVKEHFIIRF